MINDQGWFEALWNKRKVLSDKPVLFIWGMKDPVILPKNLEKFEKEFSNSKTVGLEKVGHFPQEEYPEIVTEAVSDFLLEKQQPVFQDN